MAKREWLEAKVLGRTCYITEETFRIVSALGGSMTGQRKTIADMPEDAFLIQVTWEKVFRARKLRSKAHGERVQRALRDSSI